jgi:hypothetical protein
MAVVALMAHAGADSMAWDVDTPISNAGADSNVSAVKALMTHM